MIVCCVRATGNGSIARAPATLPAPHHTANLVVQLRLQVLDQKLLERQDLRGNLCQSSRVKSRVGPGAQKTRSKYRADLLIEERDLERGDVLVLAIKVPGQAQVLGQHRHAGDGS